MSEETPMVGAAGSAEEMPPWAQLLMQEMHNIRNRTDHLYTIAADQTIPTPATSAGTSAPTPTPAQAPADRTGSSTMEQFLAAMRATQSRKPKLPNAPMFGGKRSDFRPWLQQISAKMNVDLSDESASVQFWYIHSRLEGLALNQVTRTRRTWR
jgi:hypothetical protein